MSKLQHTPGPWKYDDDPLRMRIHSEFDHDIVCHMVGNSASSMIQKREIKNANARLIAAAPDMLEVLIEFCKVNCTECNIVCGTHCALYDSKTVIERATGLSIEEVLSE